MSTAVRVGLFMTLCLLVLGYFILKIEDFNPFARGEQKIDAVFDSVAGLDPVIKALIDELIVSMRETLGSTTVTITHDMRSAFRIADRIGMLYQGKIIALAPPDEFRQLDNPIVQQFIHGRADGPLST